MSEDDELDRILGRRNPEPQAPTSSVSIWLSARGQRQYRIEVVEGCDEAELARLATLALEIERQLAQPTPTGRMQPVEVL
jgi:hypothetical protein